MTELSAYKCSPREIRRHVIRCLLAGVVPFVQSSPAMGKSSIMESIAREYNLELIDVSLSAMVPEDMNGLANFTNEGKTATYAPFDTFPLADALLPGQYWTQNPDTGQREIAGTPTKQGWMIFLDEFNVGNKAVLAACYKLLLKREVAGKKLHEKVVIVCAGNLSTDRAITTPIGTALQSRLVHLEMELRLDEHGKHSEFMEDVALPQKWDPRVIAFLNYKPSLLHDFKPEHNDKTFCSPRTWDFLQKLIKGQDIKIEDAALYAGTITSGIALDFVQFVQVYETLPRIELVVKDPAEFPIPTDSATRWATVTHLIDHVSKDNFDDVAVYMNRWNAEFRVLFFRGLRIQKPALRQHPKFREMMVSLAKYLNDDIAEAA